MTTISQTDSEKMNTSPATRPGSVSQIDVARLAGVSQAAVSRTFTPGASISEGTREKVLAAAEKLNYRPNAIARSLIQHSTRIIGIVIVRFENPFYARVLKEFTNRLQNLGYWTLLLNVADEHDVEDTLPMALQYQVDGLIITSATLSSTLANECARSGTPVVLFNRYAFGSNVNAVYCDSVGGGGIVADALLDAGHARIAYIAGEEGSSTNRDREQGFTERLQERGYTLTLRAGGDYSYESGYAAAQQLLQHNPPPDAIFCANDLMAMGALDCAVCELGIKVPQELAIVGFDDIQPASWQKYSLTTVRQPIDHLVETTIEVLMNAIANPDAETVIKKIPATLVERATTRPRK